MAILFSVHDVSFNSSFNSSDHYWSSINDVPYMLKNRGRTVTVVISIRYMYAFINMYTLINVSAKPFSYETCFKLK